MRQGDSACFKGIFKGSLKITSEDNKIFKAKNHLKRFLGIGMLGRGGRLQLGARLRGRTATQHSKKGSEKVMGRLLGEGSQCQGMQLATLIY